MNDDGEIDYSRYSLAELEEIEKNINRDRYPLNYQNLRGAMDRRASASMSSSDGETPRPEENTENEQLSALMGCAGLSLMPLLSLLSLVLFYENPPVPPASSVVVRTLIVTFESSYVVALWQIVWAVSAVITFLGLTKVTRVPAMMSFWMLLISSALFILPIGIVAILQWSTGVFPGAFREVIGLFLLALAEAVILAGIYESSLNERGT